MPTPEDRFKNRRKMAWIAFWAGLVGFPVWAVGVSHVEQGIELVRLVATPLYSLVGIVLAAYFGTASYEHTRPSK